jgi:4-hydroxy-3-methylbut-2-en-1-yl diphosphate reductase
MGSRRAALAGGRLAAQAACAEASSGSGTAAWSGAAGQSLVVVAGFCGGVQSGIKIGDVIMASELRGPNGVAALPAIPSIVEALRAAGLGVHVGPIVGSERVALGDRRAQAAVDGALGVDMESYWFLEGCTRPAAVVRAVSDTADAGFLGGMLPDGWLRAYRSLVRIGAVLEEWAGRVQ